MFQDSKPLSMKKNLILEFGICVVNFPRLVLAACIALILIAAIGLSGHHKDPSFDIFLEPDTPVLQAKERAKTYFNIDDAIVVSMATQDNSSMFTAERLTTFQTLHTQLLSIPGVRANDIVSIVSETYMANTNGDLIVENLIPSEVITPEIANAAWQNVQTMPPYMDKLVSRDGSALLISLPVEDPDNSILSYKKTVEIAKALQSEDLRIDVAGTAAANARFANLIDLNTATFTPATTLVAIFITFIALRQFRAMIGPLIVLGGAVLVTLGTMGWLGFHYYMISTALPVVVMAIAIADCLHISLKYFDIFEDHPSITPDRAAMEALMATGKPVILTSLTTIFGFAGLGLSTSIPPLKEFAFFASLGVASACVFSLLVVPASLVIFKVCPKTSRKRPEKKTSLLDTFLSRISQIAFSNPIKSLSTSFLCVAFLLTLGTQVQFNNGIEIQFKNTDEIRRSNAFMKDKFAGNGTVDIVVKSKTEGAILTPSVLQSVQSLQNEIANVSVINKVTSIVDYLSLMHHHLTGETIGLLPGRKDAPAQYMFLYESSGDTNSFQEEIDFLRQNAVIRSNLKKDSYHDTKDGVAEIYQIVEQWNSSNGLNLEAELSGRTVVTYEWMQILQNSHAFSVFSASVFVFIAIWFFFRNVSDAIIATLPVICGLTLIYATMATFNIPLSPATSMCSAISTGLGVDFGVHLIEQLRRYRAENRKFHPSSMDKYVLIARACFYSALSLALGLSVVILSWVPTVQAYGFLIAVGALGALIGALVITPASTALSQKQN